MAIRMMFPSFGTRIRAFFNLVFLTVIVLDEIFVLFAHSVSLSSFSALIVHVVLSESFVFEHFLNVLSRTATFV